MSNLASPLIAPFKTGLELDVDPWLAPPDSFTDLDNFHVEHGYLEKRNGYRYLPTGDTDLTNGTAVTGFANYTSSADGTQSFLAFDTLSVYLYSGATQSFTQLQNSAGGATSLFTGDATDYFWADNWNSTSTAAAANRLYFSNGVSLTGSGATAQDGIWYYEGDGSTVTSFVPYAGASSTVPINGCKLIFAIGQRLVLLFTDEDGTTYPQRARWCAKQNPDETTGWIDTVAGGGDYSDAATSDQIISAQLLQNQLIVFFTNSVWSLIPTSDPNKAFRWQKINNFRALEGKMASVEYDRYVASVGSRGITATDGVNTTRIDEKISNFTVENMSQEYLDQTFCLRDYSNRRWWTLYNDQSSATNKTKALIYDDDSGAYSTYSVTLNCLGRAVQGYSYQYDEMIAANGFQDPDGNNIRYLDFNNDETYSSYYFQQNNQTFVGGDYTGGVFILESGNADDGTSISASFETAAWNPFYQDELESVFPYIDIYIETSPTVTGTLSFYKNTEASPYSTVDFDFLPPLNFISTIQDITQANPANVESHEHGLSTGDVVYLYHVEGMIEINSFNYASGFTVTVVDDDNFTLDGIDSSAFTAYTSGGELYQREFYRTKTWKRIFGGGTGFQHRISFSSNGDDEAFRIHGFKPTFKPRGRRLNN